MKSSLKPMFLAGWAVLAALAVGSPAVVAAEAPRGVEELARLTVVSTRLMGEAKAHAIARNYGFWGGSHCLFGAAIRPTESQEVTVQLKARRKYQLLAAGDENAQDVDLYVTDAAGRQIAKDDKIDVTASVAFEPDKDGSYTFKLKLFKGRATSFCALVVLEQGGGFDIPFGNLAVAIGNYMNVAGASAVVVDEKTNGLAGVRLDNGYSGWCLFGSVMNRGGERGVTGLKLSNDLHVFLAVGCGRAKDIDLKVIDQRGDVLVSNFAADAHPMSIGISRAGDTYQFNSSLPESNGPALVLSGVLKVEVNPNQGIRPVGAW